MDDPLPNLLLSIIVYRNIWLGKTYYGFYCSENILKSGSHLPKKYVLFASMKAL